VEQGGEVHAAGSVSHNVRRGCYGERSW
jgi:hypothetical protein